MKRGLKVMFFPIIFLLRHEMVFVWGGLALLAIFGHDIWLGMKIVLTTIAVVVTIFAIVDETRGAKGDAA